MISQCATKEERTKANPDYFVEINMDRYVPYF